jgi:small subunit ribosomal protein S3
LGQKVHPVGFRLGVTKEWSAKWYAGKGYADTLQQDFKLRKVLQKRARECGIARVDIERTGSEIYVTVFSARPGILIGRGGQNVESLRQELEKLAGERVRLTIREVDQPETVAALVAFNIAERLESRVPYRRVMKQASFRTLQAGAQGIKIRVAGRLGGAEIARSQTVHEGRMPLHTLRADIDYGFTEAHTIMGRIGIKVWVYKGDILPEARRRSATTETSEVS